jgi:valyl-tRNA synthetase
MRLLMRRLRAHIVEGLRKQTAETKLLLERAKTALEALPS